MICAVIETRQKAVSGVALNFVTYLAFLDTDVLLRLESHQAHLEVVGVEALGRQVEDLLELEGNVVGLNHLYLLLML